jgi:uncharacterized protein YjiS (DUF1127 family)
MALDTNISRGPSASWRLSSAIPQFFRSFRAAMRHRVAEGELDGLPDRALRDIGIERRQISEAVRTEITRTSLMDAGWVRRREPTRR